MTLRQVSKSKKHDILDTCSALLISKVKKEDPVVTMSSTPTFDSKIRSSEFSREQVFLEKSKPPKFYGEDGTMH